MGNGGVIIVQDETTLIVNDEQVTVITQGAQGPQGPPGPAGLALSYIHTQSVAATTWTINHNLGGYPSIVLLSVGGQEIEGSITHTSVNQAVVTFLIPVAGQARCA